MVMVKYDREKVAKIFDEAYDVMDIRGGDEQQPGKNIPTISGEIAVERLELKSDDVLLDIGTGTGDKAIPAAKICRRVIGIDISRDCIRRAKERAVKEGLHNVIFGYGAFEELLAEVDLISYDINKMLAFYSMHHLTDDMKKACFRELVGLLHRPGRIVIGDLMFFDDPEKYQDEFDDVHYDGGEVDFPAYVAYMKRCLEELGAVVQVDQIHPLVGVIRADLK